MNPVFFVSHANTDADITKVVADAIEAAGGSAYIAENDHQAGYDLPDKLVRSIRACDAFVVLLTEAGITSDMVRREITLARAESKLIIPLVAPGVALDGGRVSGLLGLIEWVPFDPDDPIVALIHLTGLITRYRDSLVAREVGSLEDYIANQATEVGDTAQQIVSLQRENTRLKNEEMALLVGVVLLGAMVIILASGSGGATS